MDDRRFDDLARVLGAGASRRRALAGLAGMALGLLGFGRARAQSEGAADFTGMFCGGFAGVSCPVGYICVDDPSDNCDPESGGADCGGVCVRADASEPCAAILCIAGSYCCNACGGICVPIGTTCSEDLCAGEPCNQTVCASGEYCCNYSCSICAPIGGGCTEQFCGEPCGDGVCGPEEHCCGDCSGGAQCMPLSDPCPLLSCPEPWPGEPCGSVICPPGEVCCNASCGICTPPDDACIQIACLD